MKKQIILSVATIALIALQGFKSPTDVSGKIASKKTQLTFFSHTAVEDIQAVNNKTVSSLEIETGEVVFSVPMQSFEFEKALMQKHFNSTKFLDTKKYPKAKFVGKITNLSGVNFQKDGTYTATIKGQMTIKDQTKEVIENGTVTVKGNDINLKSKFDLKLVDYKIAFEKGKPANNIAKTVAISVDALY